MWRSRSGAPRRVVRAAAAAARGGAVYTGTQRSLEARATLISVRRARVICESMWSAARLVIDMFSSLSALMCSSRAILANWRQTGDGPGPTVATDLILCICRIEYSAHDRRAQDTSCCVPKPRDAGGHWTASSHLHRVEGLWFGGRPRVGRRRAVAASIAAGAAALRLRRC